MLARPHLVQQLDERVRFVTLGQAGLVHEGMCSNESASGAKRATLSLTTT